MIFKHFFLSLALLFIFNISSAQIDNSAYEKEIKEFQEKLNTEFADKKKSPLLPKERKEFKGLNFFPINDEFRVVAKFIRTENEVPFKMKTTTDRLPIYQKYGEVHFELDSKTIVLNVYQNHGLLNTDGYKDYLFLPFIDLTNGNTSYGGGRFIDLKIPDGDEIVIDFNKSYNPLCAYNPSYSCPIPPKENSLAIEINAGVMYLQK